MRPKKTILVLDPNSTSLGITVFMLATSGYRAIGVQTLDEAKAALKENPIEWAIARTPSLSVEEVPCFCHDKMSATQILEQLRTVAVRKRGPRPGFMQRRLLDKAQN